MTVRVKKGDGGLKRPSVVNLAQILTIDKSRLRHRVGTLSPALMDRVNPAIKVSLDIG